MGAFSYPNFGTWRSNGRAGYLPSFANSSNFTSSNPRLRAAMFAFIREAYFFPNCARIASSTAFHSKKPAAFMIAPIITMLTREPVAMAISIASTTPTFPPSSFRKSLASGGVLRVFRITTVFPGTEPAVTGTDFASASWKIARTCGSSTGLLIRTCWPPSQMRTNELIGVPFISEPYEANPAPFIPIPMIAASVRIFPATFAPNPPMLSIRISKNPRSFFTGSFTALPLWVIFPPPPVCIFRCVSTDSQFPSSLHRPADGDLVGVLEVRSHREPVGDPAHADVPRLEDLGEVGRRGLPLRREVRRKDHLGNAAAGRPLQELPHPEVVRHDAVDRRDRPAEDVVPPLILPAFFDRDYIGGTFHDADQVIPARGVRTESARVLVSLSLIHISEP